MTYQLAQAHPPFHIISLSRCLRQDAIIEKPPFIQLAVSFAGGSILTRRKAEMGKFNIGSCFGTQSKSQVAGDHERKKRSRRMFSYFATVSLSKADSDGGTGKTLNDGEGGCLDGKADRRSVSTIKPVSGMASNTVGTPASGTTTMIALSKKIAEETEKLERYMKANGLAMPAFDVGTADDFPKLPEKIQRSRLEIINATKELRDLAVGPRESVRWGVWEVSAARDPPSRALSKPPSNSILQFLDVLALQIINNYGIGR